MMKQLPEEIAKQIQPRLTVVWWGRRAVYEIVEEISEDAFRVYIIACIALFIEPAVTYLAEEFGLTASTYWYAVAVACLVFSNRSFREVMYWLNEIYVVARDDVNGGGRVYKFSGWLNKEHIDEPISPSSPTMLFEQSFFQRVWQWVTGEGMVRISLKSQNHTFIEGRRISPLFSRAIKSMIGARPVNGDTKPALDLSSMEYLQQAALMGFMTEVAARDAIQVIVARSVYGE